MMRIEEADVNWILGEGQASHLLIIQLGITVLTGESSDRTWIARCMRPFVK